MNAKARFDAGEITVDEYVKLLEAENEAMKAQSNGKLRMKISDKGGLSIYGLGRFPVTLYKSQWLRLLTAAKLIVQFIQDHDSELKEKTVETDKKAA